MQITKIIIYISIVSTFISCQKNKSFNPNNEINILINRMDKYKYWGNLIFNYKENNEVIPNDRLIFLLKKFQNYNENKDYSYINYVILHNTSDSILRLTYILGDLDVLKYIFENRDMYFYTEIFKKIYYPNLPLFYSLIFNQPHFVKYFIEEKKIKYREQKYNRHILNSMYNYFFHEYISSLENSDLKNINFNFNNFLIKNFEIFNYFIKNKMIQRNDIFNECNDKFISIWKISFLTNTSILYQFLSSNFNIKEHKDSDGKNALFHIIESGGIYRYINKIPIYKDEVEVMEFKEEDFNYDREIYEYDYNILYLGDYKEREKFIKYLILEGVNINLMDNSYKTALDYQYEIVDNYNYYIMDGVDIVPEERKIIKLLRKYGAKRGCELLNKKCEREIE